MRNRLRTREFCPLHHSYFCCGRERSFPTRRKNAGPKFRQPGVKIVEDAHHPRGYREICAQAELTRRKKALISSGEKCLYCPKPFETYQEIHLAHKEPKGIGGARRDDHRDNLGLAHATCNIANGSRRLA